MQVSHRTVLTAPVIEKFSAVSVAADYSPSLQSVPKAQGVNTVEALRQLPPECVLTEVISGISHSALRSCMDTVLHDPLIHGLVTLPLVRPGMPMQFPIQILRRVATHLSAAQARTRQEKDLLLVATVLWGIRSFLPLGIHGKADIQDIFCTLIRPALHALDDATYEVSMVLRGLIGLGDEAGAHNDAAEHLQSQVRRAIRDMHHTKDWLLRCMEAAIERQTLRGITNFAQRAIAQ